MAIFKSIAVAFLAAQAASAATLRAQQQHRQLSFVDIAGYQPNSQVTDHVSFIIGESSTAS